VPARKTLDCYTTLGRHAQITRENYGGYMGLSLPGWLCRWCLVIQSPRIATLLKPRHCRDGARDASSTA